MRLMVKYLFSLSNAALAPPRRQFTTAAAGLWARLPFPDNAVTFQQLFHQFVSRIIIKNAFFQFHALLASQAAMHWARADVKKFCFYSVRIYSFASLSQSVISASVFMRAAINQQYFHFSFLFSL